MAYQYKPGQFSLFVNDKGDNPKRPDYTGGGCCPHCEQQIEAAGWKKATQKGDTFLACNLQPPREQAPEQPAVGQRQEPDESVPF
jgi:hypothetical protein